MNDLMSLMPNELIVKISYYAESNAKKALLIVDKRTNEVVSAVLKCIRICPRSYTLFDSHPADIPKDILVKVISRHPKLEKIIFGPKKNWGGSDEFGTKEAPYLESFISYISYMKGKHIQHPLSSVKKIQYMEIKPDGFGMVDKIKTQKLNNLFFEFYRS